MRRASGASFRLRRLEFTSHITYVILGKSLELGLRRCPASAAASDVPPCSSCIASGHRNKAATLHSTMGGLISMGHVMCTASSSGSNPGCWRAWPPGCKGLWGSQFLCLSSLCVLGRDQHFSTSHSPCKDKLIIDRCSDTNSDRGHVSAKIERKGWYPHYGFF